MIERWKWTGKRQVTLPADTPGWFAPLDGTGSIDGKRFGGGQCWLARDAFDLELEAGADALFTYPQAGQLAQLTDLS